MEKIFETRIRLWKKMSNGGLMESKPRVNLQYSYGTRMTYNMSRTPSFKTEFNQNSIKQTNRPETDSCRRSNQEIDPPSWLPFQLMDFDVRFDVRDCYQLVIITGMTLLTFGKLTFSVFVRHPWRLQLQLVQWFRTAKNRATHLSDCSCYSALICSLAHSLPSL